ncbi:MAG: 6-phosphofructokinase [Firmicutes bacterium]|nr:6-phosphofructokinase [Bacillota bacterium]
MKRRIGILTSGGDCPGLNAAIRGVARASYELFDAEFVGIADGYKGLIEGDYREMKRNEFSGILTLGGTILGTSRRPYRNMRVIEEDNIDKVAAMKANYKKMKLDCLVTLGGNGTHKTANLLAEEGLNVIGLPKTIDNDIWGTDVTFGFHTAVDIATDVVDRIHTTANSHGRIMVIELMGNKAGWLTLYAGVAGGADIVLLPEIPYNIDSVIASIEKRIANNRSFTIIAVAEGAYDKAMADMKRKARVQALKDGNFPSVSYYLADQIQGRTGLETRVVVPGHYQRGGSPSPYDRILSTQFGTYAAHLIKEGNFGQAVAMKAGQVSHNPLIEVAGKTKFVPKDHQMIQCGKDIGISFGE